MPIVGSDVSNLRRQRAITGIPRAMVETHKGLHKFLQGSEYQILPFDGAQALGESTPRGEYLDSDPVLNSDFRTLEELDIVLLLDTNFSMQFSKLIEYRATKKLPCIAVIHDILPITNPEWFPGDPQKVKMIYRTFLQKNLAIADRIIVTSDSVKVEIENLGWNHLPHITRVHLGAFPSTRMAATAGIDKSDSSAISLLYVATFEPRKGQEFLLDAFDTLRRDGVDITLTLVGKYGWSAETVAQRIMDHPEHGRRLFWLQEVSDRELDRLHSEADLVVMPNLNEGFGLGIEEALIRGVKVLARELPVFLERPNPNLYFFRRDGEDLTQKILELAKLPFQPIVGTPIRTMEDFAQDISTIILQTEL